MLVAPRQPLFVYGVIVHRTGAGASEVPWRIQPCRRTPSESVMRTSSQLGSAAAAGCAVSASAHDSSIPPSNNLPLPTVKSSHIIEGLDPGSDTASMPEQRS